MPQAQQRLKALDRQLAALGLRKAGATYDSIKDACGYRSRQAAFKAVQAALKYTLREAADGVRALEAERLDDLLTGVYAQALSGNQGAIDRVLRIMERRAKLLGLDAPIETRVQSVEDIRVVFADSDPAQADTASGVDPA